MILTYPRRPAAPALCPILPALGTAASMAMICAMLFV
jgi:hypothetical protein